jgi:glutamate N-acetyltransferase/amino-acid N-acetyltransferase
VTDTVRAIVVNSGNANACTGEAGADAVRRTADRVAADLGCSAEEILVASTGTIGIPLPVELIESSLPYAIESLVDEVDAFSRSILTTDTVAKVFEAKAGDALVTGVAKGAAMIAPNMATMLAFIVTDAAVEPEPLQQILGRSVSRSFNRISIDGCESTNDSVFLLSTGRTNVKAEVLAEAIEACCTSLAHQIVSDAEGGTKIVHLNVSGALSDEHAESLVRSVAASALWRAAAHGGDPNWGRIVSALGASDPKLDLAEIRVLIGGHEVFPDLTGRAAAEGAMQEPQFDVTCVVGSGLGAAELLTCDLSPAYVELNAGGTT